MSRKTLNQTNLAALGADRLAALLIEVSTGSAEIKRRLRLELSHDIGPAELGRDVRKRLVSIRRSKGFVGWRRRAALIRDLKTQADMICERIAPDDPGLAFDLLWQFIELAAPVHNRVDDSRGDVGQVFCTARDALKDIAVRAKPDPVALAQKVWDACRENGHGQFDHIIGLTAPAMGESGLSHLRSLVVAYGDAPIEVPDKEEGSRVFGLRDRVEYVARTKARLVKSTLQDIAAARGDTAAYMAQYTAEDLRNPKIAAEVARMLLADGRAQTALDLLSHAEHPGNGFGRTEWDGAHLAALLALDRPEEAQRHRWSRFLETLDPDTLRAYLRALPDFDDIVAEDTARAHALQYPDVMQAVVFLMNWPDHANAAQLVATRSDDLDGNAYHILTPAADALRDRHPLAAVIAWRAMIDFTLANACTKRYGHAADHLTDCQTLDGGIENYGPHPDHETYMRHLRSRHDRKISFWNRLPAS